MPSSFAACDHMCAKGLSTVRPINLYSIDLRDTFRMTPIEAIVTVSDEPPALMRGSDMPVMGIEEVTTPMFINA